MKTLKISALITGLLIVANAQAFPQQHLVPGGIAIIPLDTTQAPTVYYNKRRVLSVKKDQHWLAVVGIPLSAKPGNHLLKQTNKSKDISFKVQDKDYPAQYITLKKTAKNKRMVNPNPLDMERITRERKTLSKALATWSEQTPSEL